MKPENLTCPECGLEMVRRTNKYGKSFWGCRDYPNCKGTRNVDGDSRDEVDNLREDEPKWRRRYE